MKGDRYMENIDKKTRTAVEAVLERIINGTACDAEYIILEKLLEIDDKKLF
jgi:hypothetical protein